MLTLEYLTQWHEYQIRWTIIMNTWHGKTGWKSVRVTSWGIGNNHFHLQAFRDISQFILISGNRWKQLSQTRALIGLLFGVVSHFVKNQPLYLQKLHSLDWQTNMGRLFFVKYRCNSIFAHSGLCRIGKNLAAVFCSISPHKQQTLDRQKRNSTDNKKAFTFTCYAPDGSV